jgi:hypothetical protein
VFFTVLLEQFGRLWTAAFCLGEASAYGSRAFLGRFEFEVLKNAI